MTTVPTTVPRRGRGLRLLLGAGGLLALVGGGYFLYSEMQQAERDRHAVIREFGELQHLIRRHDGQLLTRLSIAPDADSAHANRESLLQDLDRLSHFEDLRITDLDVVVTGDSAVAKYKAQGRPAPPGLADRSDQPLTLLAGEMTFVRHGDRWEIVGHRFDGR